MTWQFWAMALGAFILGGGLSRLLYSMLPQRTLVRRAILLIVPIAAPAIVGVAMTGWPRSEDWPWLMILYALVSPVLLAWFIGIAIERTFRPAKPKGD